jgi:hypothetical protein
MARRRPASGSSSQASPLFVNRSVTVADPWGGEKAVKGNYRQLAYKFV